MRPNFPSWLAIAPAALVSVAVPSAVHATRYLTVEQAQRQLFPANTAFADRSLKFTPVQRKAIGRASGTGVPASQRIYEARGPLGRIGWLFVDQVLGKHEMITYALALDTTGAVRGVEILDYRETYGGEIRNPAWRRQFIGKGPGASLKLGTDIRNISGATLSSRHVTDGIRRLLVTYRMMFAQG